VTFRYLSICSGIEAATVAWHPLGWEAAAFSEIEAFPRAVLKHHYPEVPLHGDFTTIGADEYGPIDLLVGGTPCQSFSVAGLRGGMDDERGQLALQFLKLLDRTRARWVVWENVPGVLSSNGGRDFGSFLGGLVELGYGFAYRVLDAQHFGVPQRRRRVFVVGYLGDWRRAAAVLFERHSLQGNPAPRREKGQGFAGGASDGLSFSGQSLSAADINGVAPTLDTGAEHHNRGIHVAHSLRAEGFDASEDGTGRGTPLVPVAIQAGAFRSGSHSGSHANGGVMPAVAFMENVRAELRTSHATDALTRGGGKPGQGYAAAMIGSAVRRLTPRECERLQGFPDDYTLVPYRGKPAADGPRYKALGNSMAVPVMAFIGQRIAQVEALPVEQPKSEAA
jgi:DNA (cytosine-5)-methyltransferase 1